MLTLLPLFLGLALAAHRGTNSIFPININPGVVSGMCMIKNTAKEHRIWAVDGTAGLLQVLASRVDGATLSGSVYTLTGDGPGGAYNIYCSSASVYVLHTVPSNRISVFAPSATELPVTFTKQVNPIYQSAGDAEIMPQLAVALNSDDLLLVYDRKNNAIIKVDGIGNQVGNPLGLWTTQGSPIQQGPLFASRDDTTLLIAPQSNSSILYTIYNGTGLRNAATNATVCDISSLRTVSVLDIGSGTVARMFYVLGWNTTGTVNSSYIMTLSVSTSAACSPLGVFPIPLLITRITVSPSGKYIYGTTCGNPNPCSATTVGRFCKFDLDVATGAVKGTYSCTLFTATTTDSNVITGGVTGNAGSNLLVSPGGTKIYLSGPSLFLSVLTDDESATTSKGLTINSVAATATSTAMSLPYQSYGRTACRLDTNKNAIANITALADVTPYSGTRVMKFVGVTRPWAVYTYSTVPATSIANFITAKVNFNDLNSTLGLGIPTGIPQGTYELYYEENGRKSNVAPLLIEDYPDLAAISDLSSSSLRGNVSAPFTSSGTTYPMATMDVTSDDRLLLHSDGYALSVQCYIRAASTGALTLATSFPVDSAITRIIYWPEASSYVANSANYIYAFRYDPNQAGCGLTALAPHNTQTDVNPHTAKPMSMHYTVPWVSTTYRAVIYICVMDSQDKLCELPWVAGNFGPAVTFTNISSIAKGTRVSVWYNASGDNMVETLTYLNGSVDAVITRTRNSAEQSNSAKPFTTVDAYFAGPISSVTSKSFRYINEVTYLHFDTTTGFTVFHTLPSGARQQFTPKLGPLNAPNSCLSSHLSRDKLSLYLGCRNSIYKYQISPITGTICTSTYKMYDLSNSLPGNVTSFAETYSQTYISALVTNTQTSTAAILTFVHDYTDGGVTISSPTPGTYNNAFDISVTLPEDGAAGMCSVVGTGTTFQCGVYGLLTSTSSSAYYLMILSSFTPYRGQVVTGRLNASYPSSSTITNNASASTSIPNGTYTLKIFYYDKGLLEISSTVAIYLNVECPPSLYGKFCTDTPAVCSASRCSAAGSCTTKLTPWITDRTLQYGCNCDAGSYGRACDLTQQVCDSSECNGVASGGVCVKGGACSCPGNWAAATNCYSCINHFDPNTNCVSCLPGYHGTYCNETAAQCSASRCSDHGLCTGTGCSCSGPFAGSDCSTAICGRFGVPSPSNLSCICDVGFLYSSDIAMGAFRCYSTCNGKGVWDVTKGQCACQLHYGGDTCERHLDNAENAKSRLNGSDMIILFSVLGGIGLAASGVLCYWGYRKWSLSYREI